jgi:hypothetical protein
MAKPKRLTKQDVEDALRNVLDLDGSDTHDTFDLFLSRPIEDPILEAIRTECLAVCLADRPPRGRDIGEESAQCIRRKLNELQSKYQGI